MRFPIIFTFLFFLTFSSTIHGQVLESAFSAYDDIFDEFKIHVNVDEYVEAIRQFGRNPYHRWNISFIDIEGNETSGFLQQKWEGNYNLWDFWYGDEFLTISTIYPGDPRTWRISHDDNVLTIQSENNVGFAWVDRYHRNFEWTMYQVEEEDFRSWYIDDDSDEILSFPMRIASALIVIETTINLR